MVNVANSTDVYMGFSTFELCFCHFTIPSNVKKKLYNELGESGADRQIRTADLTLTKGALYQLSHISTLLERAVGIEPTS
jgi:hypothetical protein